ncbi:MAG TPA: DUF4325 domain-containing protein [Candidatus Nanoarchaeia archaeon]|nr:DUF4325 domain-containing protein [Candidatus Nanoarchaeia archaeon]
MVIELRKFETILNSRQLGKEALAAFLPSLNNVSPAEKVEIDFSGVSVFSPSWGDEFLTPLVKKFGGKLVLKRTDNPSVTASIETLEAASGNKFSWE